jgi:hypothetical protein
LVVVAVAQILVRPQYPEGQVAEEMEEAIILFYRQLEQLTQAAEVEVYMRLAQGIVEVAEAVE